MARRVAICAVSQTKFVRNNTTQRFQGMELDILESLREQVDIDFADEGGIGMSINVSNDVFDARTISDAPMTDILGAHMGCEEKVDQDGAQAVIYGASAIMSGHCDAVLIIGHCRETQPQSRNMCTNLTFDPFFTRPVGLDYCSAAGFQAQAYLSKSGISEEQLAKIVVKSRENASKNPYTPEAPKVTAEEVMSSPMLCDPIRELHAYPVSDGAVGMILAAEDLAVKLTDTPVFVNGHGNNMDSFYLGDRDLTSNFALKGAAERAYKRAGITDPKTAFDIVEISDQYAYQYPMWLEGLGICDEGKAGELIDADGENGPVINASGGMLAGNPLNLGGLVRAAEGAAQLMGKAGDRQVKGAKTALAHGVVGPAGQFHTVVILGSD